MPQLPSSGHFFGMGRLHGLAGRTPYSHRKGALYDSKRADEAYKMGHAKGTRERQLAHEGHSFDLFSINGVFTPTTTLTRKPRTPRK